MNCFIGGKPENRWEKVENNSNVYVFPSNPEHDKIYPVFFDVMPPLWACYAIYARIVEIGVDMIISDGWYDLFVQVARSDKVYGTRDAILPAFCICPVHFNSLLNHNFYIL